MDSRDDYYFSMFRRQEPKTDSIGDAYEQHFYQHDRYMTPYETYGHPEYAGYSYVDPRH